MLDIKFVIILRHCNDYSKKKLNLMTHTLYVAATTLTNLLVLYNSMFPLFFRILTSFTLFLMFLDI